MFCGLWFWYLLLHSSLPSLLQLLLLNCCPSLITLILCQMSMYDSYFWSPSPSASLQSIRGVEICESLLLMHHVFPVNIYSQPLLQVDLSNFMPWLRMEKVYFLLPLLFIVSTVSSSLFQDPSTFFANLLFSMDNIYMSCVRSISYWSLSKSSIASNHYPPLFVWNP